MLPAPFYVDSKDLAGRRRLAAHPHLVMARSSASLHQPPSARPSSRPPQHGDYERMPLSISSRTFSHDALLPGGVYLPPGTHPTHLPLKAPSKASLQQQKMYTTTTTTTQTSYHHKASSHKAPHQELMFQEEDYESHLLPIIDLHHRGLIDPSAFEFACEAEDSREEVGNRFLQNSACFPELPRDAHLLLFRMGIDIFDCTEVDFHPFLSPEAHDQIPFTSNTAGTTQRHCLAVLAKKASSGQVWLLVFKVHGGGGLRSSVVFNRLLTLSCGLWMRSTNVVELSAPSTENVLFKLHCTEDGERFFRLLFQSCTVRWKRPEKVGEEEQMRLLYRKIHGAGLGLADPSEASWGAPCPRGPFTLASILQEEDFEEEECDLRVLASDLDSNWRSSQPFQQVQKPSHVGPGGDASSVQNETTADFNRPREVILSLEGVEVHVDVEGGFPGGKGAYKSLGKGVLQVVCHGKGADEVIFSTTSGPKGRDFSHFIFKWTSPILRDKDPSVVLWKGAASFGKQGDLPDVLAGGSPDTPDGGGGVVFDVPANKKFCAFFDSKEEAQRLSNALQKGVEKTFSKGGVRGHIEWYINNRCGALSPPINSAQSDSNTPDDPSLVAPV